MAQPAGGLGATCAPTGVLGHHGAVAPATESPQVAEHNGPARQSDVPDTCNPPVSGSEPE